MLVNNTKIFLGFAVGLSLWQSGYAMEQGPFSGPRSVAASSVRSTMSRREANLGKPIIYGQPERLYHAIAGYLFKSNDFVKNWDELDSLVTPNERNSYMPQLPQRVRNVVLDAGMFAIDRAVKQENIGQAKVFSVNLINFLLRDTFQKTEFHSWQESFAKALGDNQALEFFALVKGDHPEQVLSNQLYEKWSDLFFGKDGVLSRYDAVRRKDGEQNSSNASANPGRVNTFDLFETLFEATVNERAIKSLEASLQKEREERAKAELARKESEAKIAAENAARDKKQKDLEEKMKQLEETIAAKPKPVKLAQQKQQQKQPSGCAKN